MELTERDSNVEDFYPFFLFQVYYKKWIVRKKIEIVKAFYNMHRNSR